MQTMLCAFIIALLAAHGLSQEQTVAYSLSVGPPQGMTATTIEFPIRATSMPGKLKSVRFVLQYTAPITGFNTSISNPASGWQVAVESLPANKIYVRLRTGVSGANTVDGEIIRLRFNKVSGDVQIPNLIPEGTGALTTPSFVIVNALNQLEDIVLNSAGSTSVALELSAGVRVHDRITFPVLAQAQLPVRKIKFVIDYHDRALTLLDNGILRGSSLTSTDFSLKINPAPAVPPSSGMNRNVEIEMESPGAQTITGQNLEIARLSFAMQDTVQAAAITVNRDCGAGFFVVENASGQLQQICLNGRAQGPPVEVEMPPESNLPAAFALMPGYPNPLIAGMRNKGATIRFALPRPERVSLQIYNVLGQLVKTLHSQPATPGFHNVVWLGDNATGRPVQAGIYFVRMQAGAFTQTQRLLVLR